MKKQEYAATGHDLTNPAPFKSYAFRFHKKNKNPQRRRLHKKGNSRCIIGTKLSDVSMISFRILSGIT